MDKQNLEDHQTATDSLINRIGLLQERMQREINHLSGLRKTIDNLSSGIDRLSSQFEQHEKDARERMKTA